MGNSSDSTKHLCIYEVVDGGRCHIKVFKENVNKTVPVDQKLNTKSFDDLPHEIKTSKDLRCNDVPIPPLKINNSTTDNSNILSMNNEPYQYSLHGHGSLLNIPSIAKCSDIIFPDSIKATSSKTILDNNYNNPNVQYKIFEEPISRSTENLPIPGLLSPNGELFNNEIPPLTGFNSDD